MNVCYVGPCFDYSGYGEANRHFVAALHAAGLNVKVVAPSYVQDIADFGEIGQLCRTLASNDISYDVKILHVTPDQYRRYIEPGKYHIGHLFWETDRLPDEFATAAQMMDEIWTGSETTAEAIRNAGVTRPIFVYPQPIQLEREPQEPYKIPLPNGKVFKGYLFYSIFEWTERKNPKALIRAFYEEFAAEENVGLLIKTYFDTFDHAKTEYVRNELARLKREYGEGRAPIFLYKYLMDRRQVERLHITGNCYVTAHRGEGWGIPIVEAMLFGNPVISTAYGGVNDYLTEKEAYLLGYKLVPVTGMQRNDHWYASNQNWAEVSPIELRYKMREVFHHQQRAAAVGKRAKKLVESKFNFEVVGKQLLARLQEIEREQK